MKALMDAYAEASGAKTKSVILDFGGLDYMNSGRNIWQNAGIRSGLSAPFRLLRRR